MEQGEQVNSTFHRIVDRRAVIAKQSEKKSGNKTANNRSL